MSDVLKTMIQGKIAVLDAKEAARRAVYDAERKADDELLRALYRELEPALRDYVIPAHERNYNKFPEAPALPVPFAFEGLLSSFDVAGLNIKVYSREDRRYLLRDYVDINTSASLTEALEIVAGYAAKQIRNGNWKQRGEE